ncbi:MAG: peptide-methionine (R)-S-oxide reductase MsrB [Actinomycetota bacterium]|nr:peptide-methionine (R)-S-oxide reductase MsrB [Actinomycetota bacterium]
MKDDPRKTDGEWRAALSPEQYRVLRQKGTEAPFSGRYCADHSEGTFVCAACGNALFSSADKFESGSGWPSFTQPVGRENVALESDVTHGMVRTEVLCSRCGGHLGHVFDDGPAPRGQRWCINSAALGLERVQLPAADPADPSGPEAEAATERTFG